MIEFKINQMFFDKPAVVKSMDRAKRQAFSRAGAFIRTSARQSMKKPPVRSKRAIQKRLDEGRVTFSNLSRSDRRALAGSSQPGKPPFVHEGSLKRLLFFGWDQRTESVVVGPMRFKDGQAPANLEYGGTVRVRRVGKRKGSTKTVRVKPRPYMQPALQKNLDVIPRQFRDRMKGG